MVYNSPVFHHLVKTMTRREIVDNFIRKKSEFETWHASTIKKLYQGSSNSNQNILAYMVVKSLLQARKTKCLTSRKKFFSAAATSLASLIAFRYLFSFPSFSLPLFFLPFFSFYLPTCHSILKYIN